MSSSTLLFECVLIKFLIEKILSAHFSVAAPAVMISEAAGLVVVKPVFYV